MVSLTVLILTHNESLHIERCIDSFAGLTDKFFIVDSFSTDNTRERAEAKGAKVVTNPWVSYAFQFNYAIENNPYQTKWVMRMEIGRETCRAVMIIIMFMINIFME